MDNKGINNESRMFGIKIKNWDFVTNHNFN
jgi:hypothetical protein